jgi:2,4-dienoyl-CoA reductase-like NADH-dependent reductase (Old Yellow Enzyme family)
MSQSIFREYQLKGIHVKNRIVFPPVVCFNFAGVDGLVTSRNTDHYRKVAAGGAGIVITEATAVWKDGRLAPFQLGIWSDAHIPGMAEIACDVRQNGAVSLLQLHHAGLLTNEHVSPVAKAPSQDANNPRSEALTIKEIVEIREAFIAAAGRAQQAGYQGIELHGAHGYLLNQFASSFFNKRTDEYGGSLKHNLKLAIDIIHGIRSLCGNDFIIGYRLGANAPTLEDGIAIARHLESAGIDLLHVSHGGSLLNLPRTPKDFDYNWIVYSGTVIRTHVSLPVIVVNEIKTASRAAWLIDQDMADFVALGRPLLADPAWVNHVQNNQKVATCLGCKPKCKWYEDSRLCPARKS